MYQILRAEELADNIYLMEVEAKRIAKACSPGQFIIARKDDEGERIPLTICDYDREKGTITIVFQVIKATVGLRASQEEEIVGLDATEHGLASAYSGFSIMDVSGAMVMDVNENTSLGVEDYDAASAVQKDAAVEIGFRGAPGCFRGPWIYIGGRSTSVEQRGAHEGGGRSQGGRRAPYIYLRTPKLPDTEPKT